MCTWIYKSLVLSLVIAVSGCGGKPTPRPSSTVTTPAVAVQPNFETSVAVADGDVRVAGPQGYCIDRSSSKIEGDVPFVLLGNCATISNSSRAPQPDIPAVLTASVGPKGQSFQIAGAEDDLNAFFGSEQGRGMLSRSGDAATVEMLSGFEEGGIYYLHARDQSAGPIAGLVPDQWRAYLDVNGRMVSASVLSFSQTPLTSGQGIALVKDFARKIRIETAVPTQTAQPTVTAAQPVKVDPPKRERSKSNVDLRNVGLLRRILG